MQTPDVIVETWPNMLLPQHEVKATLQYLAHKAKKPVSFRWYTKEEGYSDRAVSVRVFVKDGLAATYNPDQVVINGQTCALSSEQRGMASALVQNTWEKIADEEDQLIGCVDRNRIILPIEITSADNEAARAILAHVVEQALPLLDFNVDDILKEKEEEFAEHFTSAFHASVHARLELRKEEFSRKQREAEQAYYTVLDFERDKPVLEEEIALLSKLAQRDRSALARSQAKALTQLQSTGDFSHITLDDQGVLRATTSAITIEHEGYEFPLGRYEIQIPTNGDVRIKALDEHPNADHPHPHVSRDNRPCLGNISGDLAKLIGRMRYAEALQLISKFLSSYNSDNPYERIGHFDPSGEYQDEDDDPCEGCDDKCTPYCIFSCDHNTDIYTCDDCCELRSEYCFTDCEHNKDFERFHPCEDCTNKGDEHCYRSCPYNQKFELQNPCDGCQKGCSGNCRHFERKEAMENAKA